MSTILHRLYLRYAFYNTMNELRVTRGYVAISYLLPPTYERETNYTRQIIAVYDSDDYESES